MKERAEDCFGQGAGFEILGKREVWLWYFEGRIVGEGYLYTVIPVSRKTTIIVCFCFLYQMAEGICLTLSYNG